MRLFLIKPVFSHSPVPAFLLLLSKNKMEPGSPSGFPFISVFTFGSSCSQWLYCFWFLWKRKYSYTSSTELLMVTSRVIVYLFFTNSATIKRIAIKATRVARTLNRIIFIKFTLYFYCNKVIVKAKEGSGIITAYSGILAVILLISIFSRTHARCSFEIFTEI